MQLENQDTPKDEKDASDIELDPGETTRQDQSQLQNGKNCLGTGGGADKVSSLFWCFALDLLK